MAVAGPCTGSSDAALFFRRPRIFLGAGCAGCSEIANAALPDADGLLLFLGLPLLAFVGTATQSSSLLAIPSRLALQWNLHQMRQRSKDRICQLTILCVLSPPLGLSCLFFQRLCWYIRLDFQKL